MTMMAAGFGMPIVSNSFKSILVGGRILVLDDFVSWAAAKAAEYHPMLKMSQGGNGSPQLYYDSSALT